MFNGTVGKVTKLSLIIGAMFGNIVYIGEKTNEISPESKLSTQRFILTDWRITLNNARADCDPSSGCTRYETIGYYEEYDPWFDTWYLNDSYEPNYDDYNGGSSDGGGSEPVPEAILSDHAKADILLTLQSIMSELIKLKGSLVLNADQLARLNSVIDGTNKLYGIINSTAQIHDHLILGNNTAAVADALAFLAGLGTAAGVTFVFGTSAPVLMLGALASYGVSEAVESIINSQLDMNNIMNDVFEDFRDEPSPNWNDQFTDYIYDPSCSYRCTRYLPPIFIDIDGNGLHFTGWNKSKVNRDVNGDGYNEHIAWINKSDGILVYDETGKGNYSNVNNFSIGRLAGPGKSDLDGLRTLDSNADGYIDVFDAAFDKLAVWIDKNTNGRVDVKEIGTLASHNIERIGLVRSEDATVYDGAVSLGTVEITRSNNLTSLTAHDVLVETYKYGMKKFQFDDLSVVTEYKDYYDSISYSKSATAINFISNANINGLKLNINKVTGSKFDDYIEANDSVSSFLFGRKGSDTIKGSSRSDVIYGQQGNDVIHGMSGNDRISGGVGDDTIYGGDGHDYILGNKGNDLIFGGNGDDVIRGGHGDDTIHPGSGSNKVYLGKGADKLFFSGVNDVIYGFNRTYDTLDFGSKTLISNVSDGKDTVLSFDDGSTLTLKGVATY